MTFTLQPVSRLGSWIWDNPGKASVKAGELVLGGVCVWVAIQNINSMAAILKHPSICACTESTVAEFGTKLATTMGMLLAGYILARHDGFKRERIIPRYLPPVPPKPPH